MVRVAIRCLVLLVSYLNHLFAYKLGIVDGKLRGPTLSQHLVQSGPFPYFRLGLPPPRLGTKRGPLQVCVQSAPSP